MRSAEHHLSLSAARADALFVSALQPSGAPSAAQIHQAITAAVRALGTRGCTARVAQAYGEHPETAVLRMRWARAAVAAVSGGAHSGSPSTPGTRPAYRSGICRAA